MGGTIENLKGFVAFLPEGIIVVVLLLFLVVPGAMNGVLKRAGFTKGSIAGFEWQLRESVQNTAAATQSVGQLEERLAALDDRLNQISASPATPPAVKRQIDTLSRDVAGTRAETREAKATLQQSLTTQRSIIQQVDPRILEGVQPQPRSP